MSSVPGTAGYAQYLDRLIEGSRALDFATVNVAFLDYLPKLPARILDAGSGAGQNAAALAAMGYEVVAVEPLSALLQSARNFYSAQTIRWLQDSLPALASLQQEAPFDFILADGVWHHLNTAERAQALQRFTQLLKPGGHIALSLRNGPPGLGSHTLPTSPEETLQQAHACGLHCVFDQRDQPSLYAHKPNVRWDRLVLINYPSARGSS